MKFFETIKQFVTTRQAAKAYGLEVDVHGMALCPFHADHHPSLKLDQRFYCFGCGASGDVIDFTAKLFGISLKASFPDRQRNPISPNAMQSRARIWNGSAFLFCGTISGCCGYGVFAMSLPHRGSQ